MTSTRIRKAASVAILVAALGGLRTAGALGSDGTGMAIFLGDDQAAACGASQVMIDYDVDYDVDLQGYGVSAARLSGLDARCQGYDVVVSLNGPGGVQLAEMTEQVETTQLSVVVPAGTPVGAEQLTGVSIVLRGSGA